jgi:hypothetical protein
VVGDGRYIVTSPNQREIYNPPLGGDRNVFMRSDLRFGDDDPLQWPQSFLPEYPHLVCIRKPPRTDIGFSIMWWMPDRSAFDMEHHGVLRGIGKLNTSILSHIKTFTTTLLTRAKRDMFKDKTSLINQLTYTLQDILHRLEHISTNFRTMQLGVHSIQRVFLELTACLDYAELYGPVINGELPPDSIPKVPKTIGAFTHDLTVCNRLHMAKIPVWLIRPSHTLRSLRIMAVAPVQYPEGLVALDPAIRPSYPAIFRGSHGLDMYRALAQHVLGYLRYPDPFGSVRARQDISLPAPPPEPSKREIRAKRYTPCKLIYICCRFILTGF